MSKHTPGPCGAVFRAGQNAPASCALRFNHVGPHRHWEQTADDREELLEALKAVLEAHENGGFGQDGQRGMGWARAAIAEAEGKG